MYFARIAAMTVIYKIEDYINLQKNMYEFNKIKDLVFWDNFIDVIDIFPKSVKFVSFGWLYNCPLPSLQHTKIKYIEFDEYYNKELPSLQSTNIEYIIFGFEYNKPLPSLQNTKIKYIKFGNDYNQPLPDLQNTNIKYIILGGDYNHPLPNIENVKIRTIIFGNVYRGDLLYSKYNHKIKNAIYLKHITIKKENFNIGKYKNQIFKITNKYNYYDIIKKLVPYLLYIIYNKTYIPYEIYNYIYMNFHFVLAN